VLLKSQFWQGNVREVANVFELASFLCYVGPITAAELPAHFNRRQLTGAAANNQGPISLRDLEMHAIYQSLERNAGNKPKAADELGISLKTLYNKLNQASDLEKSA
jgi:two-component system NtrC family response regulator